MQGMVTYSQYFVQLCVSAVTIIHYPKKLVRAKPAAATIIKHKHV